MEPPLSQPSTPTRTVRTCVFVALTLVTFALFRPALGFDFVSYDDWKLVRDNPAITAGLSAHNVAQAFTTPYYLNWIPLTSVSYLADHALWGLDPRGFHLTNLLLHVTGALLLLLALDRLTRSFWPSVFVAAVFALHPLQVEPVVWISSRKDVLAGVCFAATLWAWARYTERRSPGRYAAVLMGTVLGLLSKPILMTLPFLLLLLDVWPSRRVGPARAAASRGAWRSVLLEKVPLLVPVGVAIAIAFEVQPVVGDGGNSFDEKLGNAIDATFAYLRASFWPSGLTAFYPHPRGAISPGLLAGESFALALLSLTVLGSARQRPHLLVGWLWFLGALFPVIGFVEVGLQARADRYTYLPIIGVALMVSWTGVEVAARSRAAKAAVCMLAAAGVVSMCVATRAQLPHWKDSFALYERALAVTEGNYLAHYGLAGVLGEQGRLDEALAQLRLAAAADPQWPLPYERMAEIHGTRGDHAKALEIYRGLLSLRADNAIWHAGLAEASLHLGDAANAALHYRAAREGGDPRPETADALAWLLATHPDAADRDPVEAARIAGAALASAASGSAGSGSVAPGRASLLDTLAAARAAAGDSEEATALAEQARALALEGGDTALAESIAARADLYRTGQSFVQRAPASPKSAPAP